MKSHSTSSKISTIISAELERIVAQASEAFDGLDWDTDEGVDREALASRVERDADRCRDLGSQALDALDPVAYLSDAARIEGAYGDDPAWGQAQRDARLVLRAEEEGAKHADQFWGECDNSESSPIGHEEDPQDWREAGAESALYLRSYQGCHSQAAANAYAEIYAIAAASRWLELQAE